MAGPVKCPKGMCPIPAGKFKMGSTKGAKDERPVREVELSEYSMKKHPVMVGEYKDYLAAKQSEKFQIVIRGCGHKDKPRVVDKTVTLQGAVRLVPKIDGIKVCEAKIEPAVPVFITKLPEGFNGDDQPIMNVNWYEAKAYCEFYGMTLPTEAQWERGARGLVGDRKYGTRSGRLSKKEAHYGAKTTAPVCSKPENDLGLCDMAGNVSEWTADWYQKDAYKNMAAKDPKGPAKGEYDRVIRGGSWKSRVPARLRAAARRHASFSYESDDVGFRCVSVPKESKK